jgi:hypothetical protein
LTRPSQTDPIHRLAVRSATLADFVGITGRLLSEWVAGFNRNQRPSSSECAGPRIIGPLRATEGRSRARQQDGAYCVGDHGKGRQLPSGVRSIDGAAHPKEQMLARETDVME